MITCSKCGNKNRDDAKFCIDCGSPLYFARSEDRRDTCFGASERREDECFSLPFGRSILGIIFGVFIILLGISMIFELNLEVWIPAIGLLLVGSLIIAAVIYSTTRSR